MRSKRRSELKSENLVDKLHTTYEHNFKIINQILLSPLESQAKFKFSSDTTHALTVKFQSSCS